MSFVEDTAPFLTDFGVAATVGGVAVRGLFDNAAADAFGIVAETAPVLLLAAAEVPDAAVGDAVAIAGTTYSVTAVQPDGTGLLRLVLK